MRKIVLSSALVAMLAMSGCQGSKEVSTNTSDVNKIENLLKKQQK